MQRKHIMKKKLCLLIALVMMLLPVGAMAENWYLEQGLMLAERMDIVAGDEAYRSMYTSSDDVLDIVADFSEADYSAPVKARMLVLPGETGATALLSLIGLAAEEGMPEISEEAMQMIVRGLPGAIVSVINGRVSASWLAASSILHTFETYIMPEEFTPGVLFLEYPGEHSVAVSFAQTGADTVTATAQMIPGGVIDGFTKDMPFAARLLVNGMFRNIEIE